jgi:hypothetical protein
MSSNDSSDNEQNITVKKKTIKKNVNVKDIQSSNSFDSSDSDIKVKKQKKKILQSNDDSENDIVVKKKVGKPKGSTKKDNYSNERKKLIDELDKILGLDDDDREFSVTDFDKNSGKINEILALDKRIRKYFCYGTWPYYKNLEGVMKRPYLTLLKSIYSDCDYEIIQNDSKITKGGVTTKKMYVSFVKK